jgi:hypothetical protein
MVFKSAGIKKSGIRAKPNATQLRKSVETN